jgi:hypothetical protein
MVASTGMLTFLCQAKRYGCACAVHRHLGQIQALHGQMGTMIMLSASMLLKIDGSTTGLNLVKVFLLSEVSEA